MPFYSVPRPSTLFWEVIAMRTRRYAHGAGMWYWWLADSGAWKTTKVISWSIDRQWLNQQNKSSYSVETTTRVVSPQWIQSLLITERVKNTNIKKFKWMILLFVLLIADTSLIKSKYIMNYEGNTPTTIPSSSTLSLAVFSLSILILSLLLNPKRTQSLSTTSIFSHTHTLS